MLLGNYSVIHKSPARFLSGITPSDNRSNWNKSAMNRSVYITSGTGLVSGSNTSFPMGASFSYTSSTPNGYRPPYSWVIAQSDGGMAVMNLVSGSSIVSYGNLAGGRNAIGNLWSGTTTVTANLGLIVSAVAALSGSGFCDLNMIGRLDAVANLSGTGFITSALGAIASVVIELTGNGTINSGTTFLTANGNMTGDITPYSELSPENLAASVWNSLAASFNVGGTMGNKLNAAGSASDPWGTQIPGSYIEGTAGYVIGNNLDRQLSQVSGTLNILSQKIERKTDDNQALIISL